MLLIDTVKWSYNASQISALEQQTGSHLQIILNDWWVSLPNELMLLPPSSTSHLACTAKVFPHKLWSCWLPQLEELKRVTTTISLPSGWIFPKIIYPYELCFTTSYFFAYIWSYVILEAKQGQTWLEFVWETYTKHQGTLARARKEPYQKFWSQGQQHLVWWTDGLNLCNTLSSASCCHIK